MESKLEQSIRNLPPSPYPPRHFVHKTKRRAKAENINRNSPPRSADVKLSLRVCCRLTGSLVREGTPVSYTTLKYPLWQDHYLRDPIVALRYE